VKRILNFFLIYFYSNLYHSFAWSYDFIAKLVSGGEWFEWVSQTLPFVTPKDLVLEIGFGTGFLLKEISIRGSKTFGIDESQNMIGITKNRLRHDQTELRLTRGDSTSLPYKNNTFDLIISTFPSEYIFSQKFHEELIRVLKSKGKFISLLAVSFNKSSLLDLIYRFLYKITKQKFSIDEIEKKLGMDTSAVNIKQGIRMTEYKGRQLFFLFIEKF